ncbi:N-acetylmuramoyl-L-alanine amidase [archaeon]|jgi:N-acetylmuramoyl-L-alanine amidase|nr:N-acetylmuramoyl-L-alanine amidase [archaeon]
MDKLENIEYLVVHHTGRKYDSPTFVKLRHKLLRGWENNGYHYMIGNGALFTEEGELYACRPEYYQGAHTKGYNDKSLSVSLIGNYDKAAPTNEQLITLCGVLTNKAREYNISIEKIVGHNELNNHEKTCPGKNIDMNQIRDIISTRLK